MPAYTGSSITVWSENIQPLRYATGPRRSFQARKAVIREPFMAYGHTNACR
jgi:hypothetical protein